MKFRKAYKKPVGCRSKRIQFAQKNLERLNANGIIAKAECVKKKLELLEKKQKLEETRVKNFVNGYKLRVLGEENSRGVQDL